MIHRIYSDLRSFKNIDFHPGFNVLVAERTDNASERQTRNRAGKSSLIEIIHFLLGASCDKDSIFRSEALVGVRFGMVFDLDGEVVTVERSGRESSDVVIRSGYTDRWPILCPLDGENNRVIPNTKWREILGYFMFGITISKGKSENKYRPTFRSLFSYFVRRQPGGFEKFDKSVAEQQIGDQQVSVSHLLGLDWSIPQDLRLVRDREKSLKELKKAAGKGALGSVIGTASDLRTKVAVAEQSLTDLRDQVRSFRVHEQYRELEKEASAITRAMNELSDANTVDRQLVAELSDALKTETPPAYLDLEKMYQEAGVVLPQAVARRFDEVRAFHERVLSNRHTYLQSEIDQAASRVAGRDSKKQALADRQAEIMRILNSHGALDQFVLLQERLSHLEAKTETLRQQFAAAETLEGATVELEQERLRIKNRLINDYREQSSTLNQAIVSFENISSHLYDQAGSFTVSPTANGPEFTIRIQGQKSKGINNIQIFCFDLMVMQLMTSKSAGPGFLVHDSHLFDGVDVRQIARALEVGSALASKLGFQYIVTLNSDTLSPEFLNYYDVQPNKLPVVLTDASEDGGLFGFRF